MIEGRPSMKRLNWILLLFIMTKGSALIGESMEREPLQPTHFDISNDREGIPPSFDITTVNITAVAGAAAYLPCSIENKGEFKVIWMNPRITLISTDDSRYIDDSRISVEHLKTLADWTLMIREVRYNDSGEYMCQVNTKPVLIKRINLLVKVAPEIIDENVGTSIQAREGTRIELICNATGVPPPVVTWYKQHDLLVDYTNSDYGDSTLVGEVLVLRNLTRFCDGEYECNADNGVYPVARKQFDVEVQFSPEVRLTTIRIGQAIGKETLLECKVSASPHATIEWTRNGTKIHSYRYRTELFDDGKHGKTLTLNIMDIEPKDFGHFTCHASNSLGRDHETMVLYEYPMVTKKRPRVSTLPWPPTPGTTTRPGLVASHNQDEHRYLNTGNSKSNTDVKYGRAGYNTRFNAASTLHTSVFGSLNTYFCICFLNFINLLVNPGG